MLKRLRQAGQSVWTHLSRAWLLYFFGLIGAGAIVVWPKNQYMVPIGQAFLSAAVLGIVVDYYAKKDLLEEIIRDTAHLLIGFDMPISLRNKIQQIMKATIVRHNWEVRYRLEPQGDRVRVHIDSAFQVRSYAGRPISYEMKLEFEEIEKAEVTEMRCDSADGQARFHSANPERKEGARVHRFVGKRIMLQPGQEYPMRARYSIEGPREGSDVFVFGGPTANVKVLTEDGPGYEFDLVVGEDEQDVISTPHSWEFRRGFIEGQHLRIRWKPIT